jgi:hypothetical protein
MREVWEKYVDRKWLLKEVSLDRVRMALGSDLYEALLPGFKSGADSVRCAADFCAREGFFTMPEAGEDPPLDEYDYSGPGTGAGGGVGAGGCPFN